jgi:hypothetical protein
MRPRLASYSHHSGYTSLSLKEFNSESFLYDSPSKVDAPLALAIPGTEMSYVGNRSNVQEPSAYRALHSHQAADRRSKKIWGLRI